MPIANHFDGEDAVCCSRKRSDGNASPLISMSSPCLFHLSIKRPDADLQATLAKTERQRKEEKRGGGGGGKDIYI